MIPFGSLVIDKITGFKGKVTARFEYMTGCVRYNVESPVDKDGKLPEAAVFDENRLLVTPDHVDIPQNKTGGYQPDPPSTRTLGR